MSTGLPNEATNLPPRPVDAPGFIGEQLVTQITNKVADAKLKEKDDRIAGLKKKSAKDALKLTGAGMFWFSSALALNITEWQKIAVAFAIWMFFYFILTFVYAGASALLFFRIRRGIRIGVFVNFILMFVYVILEFIGEKVTNWGNTKNWKRNETRTNENSERNERNTK